MKLFLSLALAVFCSFLVSSVRPHTIPSTIFALICLTTNIPHFVEPRSLMTPLTVFISLSTIPLIRDCEFKAVLCGNIPADEARLHLQTPPFGNFCRHASLQFEAQ